MRLATTVFLSCLAILPFASQADTVEIPLGAQGDSQIALPARGESSSAVLARFGLADTEHPAVGNPPIRRWDYREFSVYFEYDHVVDAVRQHLPVQPAPSIPAAPQPLKE